MARYAESLAWLYSVQVFGIKLGLDGMRRLLAAWDLDPETSARSGTVWHVAGTNGKGSVCAFLESVLRASGRRTGLFTSPHLVSFRERIRIGSRPVQEELLAERMAELRALVQGWDPHPTFFELTTALALRVFRDEGIDALVLETGMGGRLDATNAVPSDVSVITSIGWDHRKWLGDTLAKIAAEKAGIFKPGVPAVVPANLPAEAADVMRLRAGEVGAPLRIVDAPLGADWTLGLAGSHQRWNAALAVAALRERHPEMEEGVLRRGLAATRWPARFQVIRAGETTVVVDGAHNLPAAEALVGTWREAFGEIRPVLVFGAVEDKDAAGMLDRFREIAGPVVFTTVPSQRGRPADALAEEAGRRAGDLVAEDPGAALDLARRAGPFVLVAGSLFLAGLALRHLGEAESDDFESSVQ
jgi:dihydrofolate synthase/folylpolyglutamate synthase